MQWHLLQSPASSIRGGGQPTVDHKDRLASPRNAWDSHVHVFDPANFPLSPTHTYTPFPAPLTELLEFEGNLSANSLPQNVVLVQPSPYGNDNSLLLNLLANRSTSSKSQVRAISVINPETVTDKELSEMQHLGVRGIRVNTEASGEQANYEKVAAQIMSAANRVSKYKSWNCQLFVSGDNWEHIADAVKNLPIRVIADHQGGMKGLSALPKNVTDVTKQTGYKELLRLAKSGKVFIKISGFYRSSTLTSGGYDDLEPLIKAFAKTVPQQLIWGSDWPHTGSGSNRSEATKDIPEPFRDVDNVAILKNIREWVGPQVWYSMTVTTPHHLYH
ncbi:hypothetical protein DL98DRAFT_660250 [Cadophora sp. DSE1049]|nr:hypothetical protein DL98DRAFT_660250 [Cadophora sp. DSE1049]